MVDQVNNERPKWPDGFNEYGEIIKKTDMSKSCCAQCKYDAFKGDHDACWTCADEDIATDEFYKPD